MLQMREIRGAALGATVVAAYLSLVLLSGRVDLAQFGRLLSFYLRGSLALWVFVGTGAVLVQMVRHSRSSGSEPFLAALLGRMVRERWERDRLASLVWPPLLFATLLASFNAFKQMILPTAGFTLDPWLTNADRLLFLGHDPWRVTHALFASPAATLLIDGLYHGWFLPMSVGVLLCAWLPAASYQLRTQYLLSYVGVWIGIGSVLAYLLPSAGPCFYTHFVGPQQSFAELGQQLALVEQQTGARLSALANQASLLRHFGGDQLAIGAGISAMPSVHNALAALFALAARRVSRPAGWFLTAYAVAIWIGSIHLGWHYALDGIVAIALTVGIWVVCGRIAARLERPLLAASPQPALA